jgi:hypothetical protein
MEPSVLNAQQSRLENRSLYFVLGLLSVAQSLEARLEQFSPDTTQDLENPPHSASTNPDFLYFTLGALALSNRLQSKLATERALATPNEDSAASDTFDPLKNVLY